MVLCFSFLFFFAFVFVFKFIDFLCLLFRDNGNHIITTSIEHPAVLETVKYLELEGFKVTYLAQISSLILFLFSLSSISSLMHCSYLPVDEYGQVRVADFKAALTPSTVSYHLFTSVIAYHSHLLFCTIY